MRRNQAKIETRLILSTLHTADKMDQTRPSAERADNARLGIDYPAAMGLCLFSLTYFAVLFQIGYVDARQAEPGTTEQQRSAGFGIYVLFIMGATLLALGSHAAALGWTRRRFRYVAPVTLLAFEGLIGALSAGLALLFVRGTAGFGAQVLVALLGPANVTLAV